MKILLPLIIVFLSLPTFIYAQNSVYSPLVDLSNAGQGSQVQTFEEYINFLYGFSIALAALLAVIKIVIAGAKYMLSDVISNKGEALKDIQGAILGLLLILSAVIILELINPELIKREIKFNEFQSERPALPPSPVQTTATGVPDTQFTDGLRSGTDACLQISAPQTGPSGGTIVVTANARACSEEIGLQQLTIFENNCERDGGTARSGGTGSRIVACATPNQSGVSQARIAAAQRELAYIKNTFLPDTDADGDGRRDFLNQSIPDSYIRLDGTTIIVDVRRFCEESYTSPTFSSLTDTQKRAAIDDCASSRGGGWAGSMRGRCRVDAVRGIDAYNNRVFTCRMARQIIAGSSLILVSTANGQTLRAAPQNREEAQQACGAGENNRLLRTRGLPVGFNLSDHDCYRY